MADDNTETKSFIAPGMISADPAVLPPPDEAKAKDVQWTETVVETEHLPATARLRAFEDQHFGADAVRIHDRIERGSGSPYQMAAPKIREQYEALEKLIVAEQKLAAAHTALIAADTEYDAALAATEPKPDASE